MTRVVGLAGGPEAGGRTSTAVAGLLAGAAAAGAETELVELGSVALPEVLARVDAADAVVVGSPVYRATYSSLLKGVLEGTERGRWGETTAPLQGKAVAIVMTGAGLYHYLAVDGLRSVLAGFFAAQVLSPGLFLDHTAYVDRTTMTDETVALTAAHGAALVDLATAVRSSAALSAITPQI